MALRLAKREANCSRWLMGVRLSGAYPQLIGETSSPMFRLKTLINGAGDRGHQNETVAVIEIVRGAPSHAAFSVMAER